jgi:hypothetical protein
MTRRLAVVTLLAVLVFSGCVEVYPYRVMSSHTIKVAEKQEADVVWVGDLRDGSLQRCHNAPEGPKCVRVK